ncbi:hypothetical protein HN385_05055 [archaeon]|jgi:hypothetical protein|nr:hypothetical protein [archaeon]MBT3465064.1 hypothetical protein [archaeon]MBT6869263.1 hypothetical protein [archaeon]MBT7193661.1 hypothetical protein [archaeon]MBT7380279.1 hypothetical protein [archaeon]
MKLKKIKAIYLGISIILGFVFTVSFLTVYVSDAINRGNACGCFIPIPYMILILSSLGLFVGFFSFYLIVSKQIKEKKSFTKDINELLNFLESDERVIINILIKNKGKLNQSKFETESGLHRVKIHRIIEKLSLKRVIIKTKVGKINKIELNPSINEVFVEN